LERERVLAGRKRNQRVSKVYKLNRSQATLDFVDVDVEWDTKVFISPRALTLMHTDWGDGCVTLVQNFFETVLQRIKDGDNAGAEALLQELREPNETHLGLSHAKSRGRALGDESAHDVWRALSESDAAKSGLVEDLEDTVLLIHGIGVDIVSDVTTNIIRGPLIEYTQEQCRQVGIPLMQGVPSGPMWHAGKRDWITQLVELPVPKDNKLLLVPKAIVRRTSLYDTQYYYRHYMLEHMRREELKAGSALVTMLKKGPKVHKKDLIEKFGADKEAVIKQTIKHPSVLDKYREDTKAKPFNSLTHEEFQGVEGDKPVNWDALLLAVTSIPPGKETASQYEKAIEALLTALFYPDLVNPVYQSRLHDGRKIIDIRYTTMARAGFFEWLEKHYTIPYIFVECKNYGGKVSNPELDQLSGRFGKSRGEVGILVCRHFDDKAKFALRCRDTAKDGRGFVIALDDADLGVLVEARKAHQEVADTYDLFAHQTPAYREYPLLQGKFDALIS
jgi:hypothetical protein